MRTQKKYVLEQRRRLRGLWMSGCQRMPSPSCHASSQYVGHFRKKEKGNKKLKEKNMSTACMI